MPTGKVKKRDKEDVEEIRFEEATASEQDEVLEVEDAEAGTDLFNLKEEDLEVSISLQCRMNCSFSFTHLNFFRKNEITNVKY